MCHNEKLTFTHFFISFLFCLWYDLIRPYPYQGSPIGHFFQNVNSPWCHPSAVVPVRGSHTDACLQCLEGHCGHCNAQSETACDQTWKNWHTFFSVDMLSSTAPKKYSLPCLWYQLAIWQQEVLTICLKCILTAWTGRSSRKGSTLGRGGWRNLESIFDMNANKCADCPQPCGLDHQTECIHTDKVFVGGGWMTPSTRTIVSIVV